MSLKQAARLFFKRFKGLNSYANPENIEPEAWSDSMNVLVNANGAAEALHSPKAFNVSVGSGNPVISAADYLTPSTHKLLFDIVVTESEEETESGTDAEHGTLSTYTINDDLTNHLIRSDQYNAPFVSVNVNGKLYRVHQQEFIQYIEDAQTSYRVGIDAPAAAPTIAYVDTTDSGSDHGSNPADAEDAAERIEASIFGSYAYMNSATGDCSIPSPISNTLGAGGTAISISLVASTEPGVDKIVFFFTLDGGDIPYLLIDSGGDLITTPNSTGTIHIQIDTMFRDTLTPEPFYNAPPPLGAQFMFSWKDRVFLLNFVASSAVPMSGLAYCGNEAVYIGQPGSSWPPLNQIFVPNRGEILRGGIGTQFGALLLSDLNAYLLSGYPTDKTSSPDASTAVTEHLEPLNWSIGTQSPRTIRATPFGTVWLDHAKHLRLWTGSGFPQEVAIPLRSELAALDKGYLDSCEGQWFQMGDDGGFYAMVGRLTTGAQRLFLVTLFESAEDGSMQTGFAISDVNGFCLQPVRVFNEIEMFMGGINRMFTILKTEQAGDGWPMNTKIFFEQVLGNDENFQYWHSLRFDGDVTGLTLTIRDFNEVVADARAIEIVQDDASSSWYGLIDEYGRRKVLRFEFDSSLGEDPSAGPISGIVGADNFNRANNPINTGQAKWVALGSNMPAVSSNHVNATNISGSVDVVGAWNVAFAANADQYAKVTLISIAGGSTAVAGPTIMMSGTSIANRNYYMAGMGKTFASSNGTCFIIKCKGGVSTTLATSAGGVAIDDGTQVHEIQSIVTPGVHVVLNYLINGVQILTYTDTDVANLLTTGLAGIACNSGDGTRIIKFDDFQCGIPIPADSDADVLTPPRQIKNLQIFYKNSLRNI